MLARTLHELVARVGFAYGHNIAGLHARGAGQQLPPHARQHPARQRALMAAQQAADNIGLAPRAQRHLAARAQGGNAFNHAGPLHQQVVHGVVDAVELGAQGGKRGGNIGLAGGGGAVGHWVRWDGVAGPNAIADAPASAKARRRTWRVLCPLRAGHSCKPRPGDAYAELL